MNPPSQTPNVEKFKPLTQIWTDDKHIKAKINLSKTSIMSLNIRSLNKNFEQLKQIATEFKTDIIALSEIWNPNTKALKIPNYNEIITKSRPNKKGGGVGLYLTKNIKYECHTEINNLRLKKLELIGVKIKTWDNQKLNIIAAYRPPNSEIKETFSDLEILLNTINDEPTIITGDLNINVGIKNTLSNKYLTQLENYNMTQSVKTFTRITANSKTTIDHVISNQHAIATIVTHLSLSDHQILITCYGRSKKCHPKKQDNKPYSILDLEKTKENINKINWSPWMNEHKNSGINPMYDSFHQKIQSCLVHKEIKPRKRKTNQPFFNENLQKLKTALEKKRKKFLKNPNAQNELSFKENKKNYNKEIEKSKQLYYQEQIRNKQQGCLESY